MPIPSIRMGLERGEKCIFIAPEKTVSDVNEALHAIGIDVDEAVKSGDQRLPAKGTRISEAVILNLTR